MKYEFCRVDGDRTETIRFKPNPTMPKHRCENGIYYTRTSHRRCLAFIDKIPSDIWFNKVKHDKVRKGQDCNVVFKAMIGR